MNPFLARLQRKYQEGDRLSATEYNMMVNLAGRQISGPGVTFSPFGWHIAGGGAAGEVTLAWAKITSHIGTTAPFWYSGIPVAYTGTGATFTPGDFTETSGPAIGSNLRNFNEVGPNGVGVAPIEDTTPVFYMESAGYFWFSGFNYRAAY